MTTLSTDSNSFTFPFPICSILIDLTSSQNEKNLEMLFQEPGEWKVSVGRSSTCKLSLPGVRRSPRLPQSLLFSWFSSRCPEENSHFGSRNVEGAPRKPGHRWDVLTAVSTGVPLRAHVTFAGRHHRFITPFHSLDEVALKPIECPVIWCVRGKGWPG